MDVDIKNSALSTSAIVERVKKLDRSGAISAYTAITESKTFEKELTDLMSISLETLKFNRSFLEFVEKEKDILESHYIAGNYDYLLKIAAKNPSSLELLLNKSRASPA